MSTKAFIYKYGNALIKRFRTRGLQKKLDKKKVTAYGRNFNLDGVSFSFLLNNNDLGLSRQLANTDWREYNSTKYLLNKFLGKNETILDIGANIGYFALIEAAISKNNKVFAIEPVEENYRLLRANAAWNPQLDVDCTKAAIGEKNGTSSITICEHKNWSSIDSSRTAEIKKNAQNISTEEVDTYKIDSFLKQKNITSKITYTRMDVEGYEYNIINGNDQFFQTHKPKLFIEFHTNILGKEKSVSLLNKLKSLNYDLAACITNLEYCEKDLVFEAPKHRGITRHITISDFIAELSSKNESTIKNEEGYELFLK